MFSGRFFDLETVIVLKNYYTFMTKNGIVNTFFNNFKKCINFSIQ